MESTWMHGLNIFLKVVKSFDYNLSDCITWADWFHIAWDFEHDGFNQTIILSSSERIVDGPKAQAFTNDM